MRPLFLDTRVLDKAARERYDLTEELMMENAASALERAVIRHFLETPSKSDSRTVAVLCGGGNNGADGYALARRLAGQTLADSTWVVPVVIAVAAPKSDLCRKQAARAKNCGVQCMNVDSVANADTFFSGAEIIVDCLFGSGFHGDLDEKTAALCVRANAARALRIACDVPTGLHENGTVAEGAFVAECTVTMGALKLSLYGDAAKDIAGHIVCEDLGISRALFEAQHDDSCRAVATLLEATDIVLPHRPKNVVNKGSFGHVAVASGEKIGASCIAGAAALRFGAGLVSLVRLGRPFTKDDVPRVSPELMTASDIPANVTALAFGMGLGRGAEDTRPYFDWLRAHTAIPCVIDADAVYDKAIASFLHERAFGIVLTPHPKELQMLLRNCGLGDHTIAECVNNRPILIESFCRAFPGCVLLVKGANPMIGHYDGMSFRLFVNPLGKNCLAKAGSGDVLAGLIAALLAQGYAPLDAAINGSLAHALASRQFKNDFSLTPLALIDAVAAL